MKTEKLELKHLAPYLEKYSISDSGEVLNKRTGKLVKHQTDKYGYERVNMCFNGIEFQKTVHRLVAMSFIPNPDSKEQVNHKNGVKNDNRVDNLEWCTNQENRDHAVKMGLHKHQKYHVYRNGVFIGNFNSSKQVADALGIDQSSCVACANGKYKSSKGYKIVKS